MKLRRCGDRTYLFDLVNAVPTVASAEAHAEIVREKAALRQVLEAANGMTRNVYGRQLSTDEIVQNAFGESQSMSIKLQPKEGDQNATRN